MRKPDFIIGSPDRPYLYRWYMLPRNRWLNVYLHKLLRDDDDRALHDHPWASVSIMLAGSYVEVTARCRRTYTPGSVIFRTSEHAHRLELVGNSPCWTLFITGPRVRDWGFHCPKGWVPWQRFVAPSDHGNIGLGCGEMS